MKVMLLGSVYEMDAEYVSSGNDGSGSPVGVAMETFGPIPIGSPVYLNSQGKIALSGGTPIGSLVYGKELTKYDLPPEEKAPEPDPPNNIEPESCHGDGSRWDEL
jgi:hypothetical protein